MTSPPTQSAQGSPPGIGRPPIIEHIVTIHAEDAAFLWTQRCAAVHAPHYDLDDLASLDERVEAHLDGLRIAGEGGWEIALAGLEDGQGGELFALADHALTGGVPGRVDRVLELAADDPERERELISALGWQPFVSVAAGLASLANSESRAERRMGIAGLAVHRRDPGAALDRALEDPDPGLRARAVRAVGELGCTRHGTLMGGLLSDDDPECRFWAAWSAALTTERSDLCLKTLGEFAVSSGPHARRAIFLEMRCLEDRVARARLDELWGDHERADLAIAATGAAGFPDHIERLVERMADDEHARSAGEALSMITGVDLAYENLDRDQPEGLVLGPSEDPEDEDVAMDPQEDLPWPDPALVARWGSEHVASFSKGERYLVGCRGAAGGLKEALRKSKQRQRAGVAAALALMGEEIRLYEVRAPAWRQLHEPGGDTH